MSNHPTRFPPALGVALAAAAGTTAVFSPQLFLDGGDELPRWLDLAWLALLAAAAPVVAAVFARRLPADADARRMFVVGLPQMPLVVALVCFDVWLDVRSGYLLAGSGEVEMAYSFGSIAAAIAGGVLAVLVGFAAVLGARHRTSRVIVTSGAAARG